MAAPTICSSTPTTVRVLDAGRRCRYRRWCGRTAGRGWGCCRNAYGRQRLTRRPEECDDFRKRWLAPFPERCQPPFTGIVVATVDGRAGALDNPRLVVNNYFAMQSQPLAVADGAGGQPLRIIRAQHLGMCFGVRDAI